MIAHGMLAGLFLFSAVLQLNDPDPVAWVVLYGAAVGLAVSVATGWRSSWRRPAALVLAVVALGWALAVAFSSPTLPPLGALVADWEMHDAGVEERRETIGLLVVSLYAAWLGRRPPASG